MRRCLRAALLDEGPFPMKPESTAVGRAPERESDEFISRKLIRPALRKVEGATEGTEVEAAPAVSRPRPVRKMKPAPEAAERTHAEDFYYQKQMAARTLMTVFLKNGEVVQGVIEWYDRDCIKLSRIAKPNLLLYKPGIRYMHKSDESR